LSVPFSELKSAIKEVLKEEKTFEPTENHVDHVCGCPDCYCGVIEKARKDFDYQCSNCGLPIPPSLVPYGENDDMKKPCPNCGEVDAEKIEREE